MLIVFCDLLCSVLQEHLVLPEWEAQRASPDFQVPADQPDQLEWTDRLVSRVLPAYLELAVQSALPDLLVSSELLVRKDYKDSLDQLETLDQPELQDRLE